ncbi:pilus assembly PilX family protein [Vreelandella sp.]|uniref:pilus assembly PilX family protein n=1 Tax=Vreelandella sp. TaxID=3137778 RepID=UPI003BA8D9A7
MRQPLSQQQLSVQQQGAALVIVMVLLASALVMAMMGMQTALVDERLAGNFRASTQAQMRAEMAAATGLTDFEALNWEGAPTVDTPQSVRFNAYADHPKATHVAQHCPQRTCFYLPVMYQSEQWVMALGAMRAADATVIAQSWPLFIRREAEVIVASEATPAIHPITKTTVVWQ